MPRMTERGAGTSRRSRGANACRVRSSLLHRLPASRLGRDGYRPDQGFAARGWPPRLWSLLGAFCHDHLRWNRRSQSIAGRIRNASPLELYSHCAPVSGGSTRIDVRLSLITSLVTTGRNVIYCAVPSFPGSYDTPGGAAIQSPTLCSMSRPVATGRSSKRSSSR